MVALQMAQKIVLLLLDTRYGFATNDHKRAQMPKESGEFFHKKLEKFAHIVPPKY
jgi:hypothetical protein